MSKSITKIFVPVCSQSLLMCESLYETVSCFYHHIFLCAWNHLILSQNEFSNLKKVGSQPSHFLHQQRHGIMTQILCSLGLKTGTNSICGLYIILNFFLAVIAYNGILREGRGRRKCHLRGPYTITQSVECEYFEQNDLQVRPSKRPTIDHLA